MVGSCSRRQVVTGLGAAVLARSAWAAPPVDIVQSATRLRAALAARTVSSRELVEASIARIEAHDGPINAVVVRDFDRARKAADAADAAIGRGEQGALLGLPMTVKEQFNVAGLPTSWGIQRFQYYKPPEDALAVQRLKAAGAIILGKTNVPAALSDWQSYNPVYGTTNNPWDLKRSPGGSSGGAAAALATGFVPLELGSDIGGSLRAPAHFCGVYSHKPSIDLVPQRGSGFPGTPANPVISDMAVIGPMARSAGDLALALDVLAGPDARWGGAGYRLDLPAARHDKLSDFRVLLIDAHSLCPTANAVKKAVDDLADRLGAAGCQVARQRADLPNLAVTTRVYVELLAAFFAADAKPEDRLQMQARATDLSPEDQGLAAAWVRGSTMSHVAWIKAGWLREGLRTRWNALFDEIDVIICPPMPTPAFPHDHSDDWDKRRLQVDGRSVLYGDQVAWAAVATMCGLPATTAPTGLTESGLPVGVQIIGGYLQDRTTIAFAGLLEREFGGYRQPPGI